MSPLCVSTLCVSTLCVSTLCVSTLCVSTMCEHYEHTKKKFLGRVLGPDRRNLTTSHITHHCISPDIRHHISPHHTSQAERREPQEEVLGPSSWAGWLTTPHHISDIHISSHAHLITPHHTFISHHIKHHKEEVLRVFS